MQPYFYKIQELATGKIYVGCQYGKTSDPANFWVSYFTSCDYVNSKSKEEFSVICIKIRPDAREYERRYLSKAFNILGREKFEKLFINRNLAPGIIYTDDIRRKMSEGIKKWHANTDTSGEKSPMYGKKHTEETKRRISNVKTEYYSNGGEHPRGMAGKKHSEDTKNRIKQSSVENSAMKGKTGDNHPTGGTIWWNNGIKHKRSAECPGDGWTPGRIFSKRNTSKVTMTDA